MTTFFSAETERQYASVVNNMSTKCCRGRSFTSSYSTSRYSCCNGILRSKRLYDCNKTKYGNGHLVKRLRSDCDILILILTVIKRSSSKDSISQTAKILGTDTWKWKLVLYRYKRILVNGIHHGSGFISSLMIHQWLIFYELYSDMSIMNSWKVFTCHLN